MIVYHGGVQTIKFPLAKIGRPNNQLCLINQQLIDECFHFINVEPLNLE